MRFRELRESDFPLLLEWLERPHIKEWWNDGDDTLAKVAAHYSSDPERVKRFLLVLPNADRAETPAGYFQYYVTAGSIGIDQFIADASALGKGLGTRAIGAFIDLVRERVSPKRIVVDPAPGNARAIRCYEKIGFRFVGLVERDGVSAYLMELWL